MHKVWHMIFLLVIVPVMKQPHCTLYLKKKKKKGGCGGKPYLNK